MEGGNISDISNKQKKSQQNKIRNSEIVLKNETPNQAYTPPMDTQVLIYFNCS